MAQTTTVLPESRQRYYNNDGTPCAGGKLWTYAAGTTALKATYADADGTVPNPNPVTLDAHGEAVIFWAGAYKVDLKQADGQQVTGFPVDNIRADPAGIWGVRASVLATLSATDGADQVGFLQSGANAVARTVRDRLRDVVNVFDFMTPAQIADVRGNTGLLDLTAPIQAAVNFAYASNVGTVYFPAGRYEFTTIVRNWDAVRSVNIVGAGKRSTVFAKFDASTTPLFQWSANDNILETYSNFECFSIAGNNKTHHGIQMIRCARFTIRDVDIRGCDKAIDNQGALVWYGQGLTLQGNNYGLYATRAPMPNSPGNYIYPNAITLRDSNICFNTSYAIYGEYANGMRLRDLDIEANGTAGDQNTGGVIVKSLNLESGTGSVSVDGCWFELNKGWAFTMDDGNTVTSLSLKDTHFIGSELGRAARIMRARSAHLAGVMALSPGDTITVVADHSLVENCTISTLTDTSNGQTWINVVTSTTNVQNGRGFSNGLEVSSGKALKFTWGNGVGVASMTPDTNNGAMDYVTPSGLHRINNHIGFASAVAQANVKGNNTLFVDAADGILKFRDANGTVRLLY